MVKRYAQVVHMAKRMNMVGGSFLVGSPEPGPPKSGAGPYCLKCNFFHLPPTLLLFLSLIDHVFVVQD